MSELSVVIVNYNTCDDLRACLIALHACSPLPEIIVVDNASTDGSASMVKREFPSVKLLPLEHNSWFCAGNNQGIDVAGGEYVLLLNPDTVPAPDSLNLMLDYLKTHYDYAGVTAQLRYPDGSIQLTCSRKTTYAYLLLQHTPLGWLFVGWHRRLAEVHWYNDWDRTIDADVEVIPGSCTMMRRRDIHLDSDLLLYFPEDDLSARLETARFRYLADAHIIHREKSVTRTWLATQVYFRDMSVFARKHFGLPRAILLWLLSRPLLWGMAIRRHLTTD
jgi:N-acetylglucosaminyl-diphospho-decaprenol L-rhamnosyltransferase